MYLKRRRYSQVFSPLLLLLLSPNQARAHDGDHGPTVLRLPGTGITLGTTGLVEVGMGEEAGHVSSPQILVVVGYQGLDRRTQRPGIVHRYFWVSGQVTLGSLTGDRAPGDVLGLTIVPATRLRFTPDGRALGVRYAPMAISRDVSSGINRSVTVHAIGWSYLSQTPLRSLNGGAQPPSSPDEPEDGVPAPGEPVDQTRQARFVKLAQVAVDVLGLRYLNYVSSGDFLAAQAVNVQALAGLGWNPNQTVQVNLSLGGRAGLAAGASRESGTFGALMEGEFFGQIQLNLTKAFARFSLFFQAGLHGYHLYRPTADAQAASAAESDLATQSTRVSDSGVLRHVGGSHDPTAEHEDAGAGSSTGHAHGYLQIGFTVSF
jgi:hypothetical protein